MRIAISADSTCDMPEELVKKYDFRLNAMPFSLGEKLCHDGIDGNGKDVFKYVEETGKLPTTSAYNAFEYKEHFEKILQDYDAVIHFSFSTEISSTGNNARMAAEEMENVYVIDSRSASAGFSILMLECYDKIQAGGEISQIVEEMKAMVENIHLTFVIDTLKFLHKGGRCSGIAHFAAAALGIKPRISLVDGKMVVVKKYHGKISGVAKTMVEEALAERPANKKRAIIIQSSPLAVTDEIVENLKNKGFEEVYVTDAGPSICIHCGPNTLGIAYLAE